MLIMDFSNCSACVPHSGSWLSAIWPEVATMRASDGMDTAAEMLKMFPSSS